MRIQTQHLRPFWHYILLLLCTFFLIIFTIIAMTAILHEGEVQEATVFEILMQNFERNDMKKNITKTERKLRDAQDYKPQEKTQNKTDINDTTKHTNYYYEEQTPTLVQSGRILPAFAQRQPHQAFGLPFGQKDIRAEQQPYYEDDGAGGDSDEQVEQTASDEYANDDYEHSNDYYNPDYGDNAADNSASDGYENEGRSADQSNSNGNDAYDAYYRAWYNNRAKVAAQPMIATHRVDGDRKMQQNRYTSAAYGNKNNEFDYLYTGLSAQNRPQQSKYFVQSKIQQQQQQQQQQQEPYNQKQLQPQQISQRQEQNLQTRRPSTTATTESTLIAVLKGLKMLWDIYQAISAAWNSMAENQHYQKTTATNAATATVSNATFQESVQHQQQKFKQNQQLRINSKKPQKFVVNNKFTKKNSTKLNRTTTTATTASTTTTATESIVTATATTTELPVAINEPRHQSTKGDKAQMLDVDNLRKKRGTSEITENDKDEKAVAEGRYIKGDPLKGYYDFVITEGSYKFWAVFQVGTAILIIYSTFAAIYYSKVNPLVSDYDYTDYLGGGRSLSGGNFDFVDDDDDNDTKTTTTSSWLNWLPRTGHSLKFILDAIDKLPTFETDDKKSANTQFNNNQQTAYEPGTEIENETVNENDNDYYADAITGKDEQQ